MFTPEELAEMAAADAEIEAEFHLTPDDLALGMELDRISVLEKMTPEKWKAAQYKRAYYEANKDKVAQYKRAYYEANKDKLAQRQRAYYEANKDKLAQRQRAYYEANKDKLAQRQRAIARARKARSLNQSELARLIGVTRATVSNWEAGRIKADWPKLLLALPELAGMDAAE